ncbi:MAG: hypothetical protein DI564_15305 [Rhodanobacter denitrificans]|uniref:Photosynthesis system II assembly factor Ycf48/Hcf136-like domain-containing protein n=1 Tax=Rhodanobacter denitrificans TaxID=666685 RepID=A0A2W5K5S6_9GAMM|nr:MAG: hypothetical protein DI564_15305 [Rhodanobacter denitrificans]
MRIGYWLACATLAVVQNTTAGTGDWVATGPDGGTVAAIDRSATTLYVASTGHLYRSNDDGALWQATAEAPQEFGAIAVSRHDPQRILAAAGSGILRSTDGGATWSRTELPGWVSRIVRSALPERAEEVIAVAGEQLVRSTDDGITWQTLLDATGQPLAADDVAADPRGPSYYAVERFGRLLASTDGGLNWRHVASLSPSGMLAPSIVVDATDSRFVYVVTYSIDVSYVHRYRTDTLAYQRVHTADWHGAVIVDPWTPGRLWVSGSGIDSTTYRVFESTDHGESWQPVYSGARVALLAADTHVRDRLYGQNALGLVVSDDAGRTWTSRTSGIDSASIEAVSIDPRRPTTLLAALSAGGVRISTDQGANWDSADAGLSSTAVRALTRHPVLDDVVYAATDAGLHRSDDQGRTWQPVSGAVGRFSALAIDTALPQRMTALRNGAIVFSADGGETWQSMFPDARAIEASPAGGPVYALLWGSGSAHTVMRAPAHGQTFEIVGGDLRLTTLAAHPYAPSVVIGVRIGTPATVYLSSDGGTTWQVRSTLAASGLPRVAFDRCDGASVLLAIGDSVYRSADWGATWQPAPLPKPSRTLADLSVACTDGHAYAALGGVDSGVQVRVPAAVERISSGGFEPF